LVEKSQPKGKRTETTIRQRGISETPDVESLPDAPSTNGDTVGSDSRTYKERTMAILNLSDTVNIPRLEKLLEPYGTIKKISLRPDHGGAFVEFAEAKSVGTASLAIDGVEIDGKKVQVGTVEELFKQEPEHKASKIAERLKETATSKAPSFGSGFVSRPGQGGTRRGGRLGQRKGLGFTRSKQEDGESIQKSEEGKSNAQFRELFLKAKETNGTKEDN
jgi:RNA recognition motif-containing protein